VDADRGIETVWLCEAVSGTAFWTHTAAGAMEELPAEVQDAIRRQLSFAVQWPLMFPLALNRTRWRNHRKIVVDRRWVVLYRVVMPPEGEDQIYIIRIVPARSDS
jgi:hypothetical protein